MALNNEQTTARMSQLFGQARRYFELQKSYLSLRSVEVMTRLFTGIALTTILILIGFLVILFACFAIAYWLGSLLDSNILGFTIISVFLVLCALLVYVKRVFWIVLPITRFMIDSLGTNTVYPSQEGITLEKEHLHQELSASEDSMKETASQILAPVPEARNRVERISNLFQNGMMVYRGIQIGLSAIAAAQRIFGLGRKRRK